MGLADLAAQARADGYWRQSAATFGHLAPEPRRWYPGEIVFACAGYGGDIVIIDADFEDLPDSPWLHADMLDFVVEKVASRHGKVLRWTGVYMKYKNGRAKFVGPVQVLRLNLIPRRRDVPRPPRRRRSRKETTP